MVNFSYDGNHLLCTDENWIQVDSKKLFVRGCYAPIYDLVVGTEGTEGAFVMGTPGVGKSCFLDYALYRLHEEGKTVLYLSGPKGKAYIYVSNGSVEEFPLQQALDDRMAENVDFVLYDPHENAQDTNAVHRSHFAGKKFIISISPDEENCKKLRKDVRTAFNVYMGPTSFEEAEAMRTHCYPHIPQEVVTTRYAKLGGIPRYLYMGLIRGRDQSLEDRLKVQSGALKKRHINESPSEIDDGQVSSEHKKLWSIYHLTPGEDAATGNVDYLSYTIELCCVDVRARLRDQLMTKSIRDLWLLYRDTEERMGTLRGIRYDCATGR